MDAGEDASAGERVEEGAGVAPGDEDSFFCGSAFVFPFDGDAVGGILAGDAGKLRESFGADLLESDEANPCDGVSLDEFRAEGVRKQGLDDFG